MERFSSVLTALSNEKSVSGQPMDYIRRPQRFSLLCGVDIFHGLCRRNWRATFYGAAISFVLRHCKSVNHSVLLVHFYSESPPPRYGVRWGLIKLQK